LSEHSDSVGVGCGVRTIASQKPRRFIAGADAIATGEFD
jgi:hypothetical protein